MKPQGDVLVSLRNVAVFYWLKGGFLRRQKFWALQKVTVDLHRGESLGVIGRNGAGKTTLLQLLAGITVQDRGEIRSSGYQAALLSLQLGFVPYLTGRENAILSGMLLGLHKQEVLERLDGIIDYSELEEFIDQPISSYSSGMRARLGFAVAFQLDPEVLLIDEVLGVGDLQFRQKSTEHMRERIRSNKTVVLVSHSLDTIREVCDRVLWIEKGATREVGDTETVLTHYQEHQGTMSRRANG